jgi:hypothetical protein
MGIFLAIGVVILGFIAYDITTGVLAWWVAFLAIVFGLLVGYGIGRAGRIRWHDTEDKIVSQIDIVGVIAILLYIGVRFGSLYLLGEVLSGAALSAATLAVLGGALVGRYLGTRHTIVRTLDRGRA